MTAREAAGKILLVDDDPVLRASLSDLLSAEGFEVATAEDGLAALECLATISRPCLILLDLGMPRMDGWEFLSRLNGKGTEPRVPVVLLSGLAYIRDAPGVADFLAKPIRPDRLLACVRRFCPKSTPSG
ncbi:MAG: response regulator [Acidobacteriota bacterium]|nr:response regulator [Acidobacteriota bacterium]